MLPATNLRTIIGAEFSSLDGRAVISRRFAVDWKQVEDGAAFSGDTLE
jgi:hypothetical protein